MEQINEFHRPPLIKKDDFEAGNMDVLSYSPEDVSQAIVAYVKDGSSSRQQEAKDRFEFEGTWNLGNPENIQDLKRLFHLYNAAYFNGLLTDYCHIEVVESLWEIRRAGGRTSSAAGSCEIFRPGEEPNPRYRIEDPYVRITITQDRTNGSIYQRVQRYQSALLHQMLHAMFLLYTCVCERGCAQKVRHNSNEGAHHLSWQAAAQAIEEVDRPGGSMFGFGTDLSRNKSMATDLLLGYHLSSDASLRYAGLNIIEILKYRDSSRRAAAREDKFKERNNRPLRGSTCLRDQWTVEGWEKHLGNCGS
ncbi:hypothetical protein EG329_000428 [Mollisiaceae sp. DMI_Dod_QoI]|nr:hypothetical protein EG329_000428 [Helotiales sp. DMI_Dod_QoI]